MEKGKGAVVVEGFDCDKGCEEPGRLSCALVVMVLGILDVAVAVVVET